MNEAEYIAEVHRRERQRAEAIFDSVFILVACVVLGVLAATGVLS